MAGTTSSSDSSGKRSNAEMDRSKDHYSPDQKNPKQFSCREEMMGKFMHLKDKDLENATKMIDDFSKMKAMNEKLERLLSRSKVVWKDEEDDDDDEVDDESMDQANLQANSTALNDNIGNKDNAQTTEALQDNAASSTAGQTSHANEKEHYAFTVRIKFSEKKSYQPIQLMKEIVKYKGDGLEIENAFINSKNNQLYIFTNDRECYEHLNQPWSAESFGGGAEVVGPQKSNEDRTSQIPIYIAKSKTLRYFCALKNVDIDIELEKDETFKQACEKYGIKDFKRIIKTSTKQALPLVRCEMKDLQSFEFILKNKFKYGFIYFSVTEWKFDDSRPLQCYHCLQFGHHQRQCEAKQQKCLVCAGDHRHKECPDLSKLKCVNCEGDHAACSKKCIKSIEAIALKKISIENRNSKKNHEGASYSAVVQNDIKDKIPNQRNQIETLTKQLIDLTAKFEELLKVVNSLNLNKNTNE
jgi:hypothetical protein